MEFYEMWMEFLSKTSYTCEKVKMLISDQNVNMTFISIDKKPSELTSKNLSESRRLFYDGW